MRVTPVSKCLDKRLMIFGFEVDEMGEKVFMQAALTASCGIKRSSVDER
jgi:hypothetical protein